MSLTVEKAAGVPFTGIPVYVFSSSGSYLSMTRQTDAQGRVSFDLSDGSYQFRADYSGYQFWSNVVTVPGMLSDVLTIAHQDVTVTVNEAYQSGFTPIEGMNVYLFTSAGAYQGINLQTDAQGQVTFGLPDRDYKVRADYLGGRYWSEVFNATDAAVDIAHGRAAVHIAETGSDIYDAPVYLFTETGSYLGRMQRTDSAGMARFLIPAGAYKFRVDCNGTQYWSDVINVLADEETAVDLALDLLAMDLTNDPDPVRLDGKPPKLEKESVLLASLFDITGLLVRKVFADTGDDDAVFYYINDHLGTPQIIIDETGNIVWKGDYQPFGSVDAAVSDLGNHFRFAGQYYDAETGLHYNFHRYYDPNTGRYLRADPIGLNGGMNPYVYVQNNPVNLIDPEGLSPAGWIIKLTKSGYQKISTLGYSAAARQARRQGENVLAPDRQAAKAIERGAFGGSQDVLRHAGHDLPGGSKGMPHFQTPGKSGHTFWGGVLGFLGSLLDPFDAISGELAGPEYDMIPLTDYDSPCK